MTGEEWDYTSELHAAQQEVARQRSKVYDRTLQDVIHWDDAEREWLDGARYKLTRVQIHTRSRAKAMDDLVDAANYIALLYERLHKQGFRPATSEQLAAAEAAPK